MIEKFTIVGGGSAYTPGLFAALLHHAQGLHLQEVRLYDIDEMRLEIVSKLCQRLAEFHQAPFKVSGTTNLVDAVKGIDCALNSSRPGLFECRQIDETLPPEFEVPGQETVGPGILFCPAFCARGDQTRASDA